MNQLKFFVFMKPLNIHKEVDLDKSWLYIPIKNDNGIYSVDIDHNLSKKISIPYSSVLVSYTNAYNIMEPTENKIPCKYFTIDKDTNEINEISENIVNGFRDI